MNTQKIGWQIIIWVLTVESWELLNLRLENTRLVNVNDWIVQKAYYMNLSCKTIPSFKIPIVQVRWRFKLIQYSLNSQYSLRKLNEKSRKTGVYIHLFFPFNNSNSSNMTLQNMRLLNKNNVKKKRRVCSWSMCSYILDLKFLKSSEEVHFTSALQK